MGALSSLRGWFGPGGLGFTFGNVQPLYGPLFAQWGIDRTLGGCAHELDALDGTGWQRNLAKIGGEGVPVIAAIHQLHRSAFAQLRPHHKTQDLTSGDVAEVFTSAASRVLITPNAYESGADLFGRIADNWLWGEALVIGIRNNRAEIQEMHLAPWGQWMPRIDPETRAVFYVVADDPSQLFEPISLVAVDSGAIRVLPASDVMHLRWSTPRHPLIGESALAAAGLAAGVNVALSRAQLMFIQNMRRPSSVLSTDQTLDKEQMRQLRERFDEQAKGWTTGGLPILGWGLKLSSSNLAAIDTSVIESLRYTNEDIARCVLVAPPLYGDVAGVGHHLNTEALINHWLSVSLGGLIERFERSLERLFGLDGRHDYIQLSTEALLRTDLASHAEALSKLVQGGVLQPNEARKQIGEGPADGGDQLIVQRQMVPLALAA
ncbi:MAG TPA: phage portal protein, partial [Candidatus Cybelea sp.]|nr:phage portal protein [Candidatus Cybelea sp.]